MNGTFTSDYFKISEIKNKQYLSLLKRLSVYYKYGKYLGDKELLAGIEKKLNKKDIEKFIKDYTYSNKLLLDYFIRHGLTSDKRILEFSLSSLLSFQNIGILDDVTSVINYRINTDTPSTYILGEPKKDNIRIYDDFDFNPSNYDVVINNSTIDLLRNFSEKYENPDEHSIKFSEDNNLDFYSGFAIRNDNPLRRELIEDFVKSVDKTKCSNIVKIEKDFDHTYAYIKRDR